MKICKVKITKRLEGNKCTNIYPVGYNSRKINVIAYDEYPLSEGDNVGYCVGLVSSDFNFTADMEEITKTDADTFIDARAETETSAEDKAAFATTRKGIVDAHIG